MIATLFYRLVVNPLRRWAERDSRLLVEQWKAAYGPPPKSNVRPFLNLVVTRAEQKRRVA